MTTLVAAIDRLRPEFPARDLARKIVSSDDTYFATLPSVAINAILDLLPDLRQRYDKTYQDRVLQEFHQFAQKYRVDPDSKKFVFDGAKLRQDYPEFCNQRSLIVQIKMIDGRLYTNLDGNTRGYKYVGSGFMWCSSFSRNEWQYLDMESYQQQMQQRPQGNIIWNTDQNVLCVLPCGLLYLAKRHYYKSHMDTKFYIRDMNNPFGPEIEVIPDVVKDCITSTGVVCSLTIDDYGTCTEVPSTKHEQIIVQRFGNMLPHFMEIKVV